MSVSFLPKTFEPVRLAEAGTRLCGDFRVEDMSRYNNAGITAVGIVAVDCQCFTDIEAIKVIQGTLNVEIEMNCQRCMQTMPVSVVAQFAVSPVFSDQQAKQLPSHYEPLLLDEPTISLARLIEDEILLNVPMVPLHGHDSCETKLKVIPDKIVVTAKKSNPFQALEALLEKTN